MHSTEILRIIDANANRAIEGLRVAEDYARFVLDDAYLTSVGKNLRHDLVAALSAISYTKRTLSRETQADVGVSISTTHEMNREVLSEVVIANLQRAKQAVRTIEEMLKVEHNGVEVEQIRYRLYTWEKAIAAALVSHESLEDRRLYVLVDTLATEAEFQQRISDLAQGGADIIQLRDKIANDRLLLSRGELLRSLAEQHGFLFIMNDRPDLAVLTRAHGVHVGQDELSVKDVRKIVGCEMLVGVSTHSIKQARQAVNDGASYIGVGPTFPSQTKTFESYPGLELLKTVAQEIGLPAFAIGGVTRANLADVLQTGFSRICVSQAVAAEPLTATRALRKALS